jgi:3-(3-hydroxy-phenyl)propionate hydroxylase
MFGKQQTEVLIVGAGPVGQVCALLLAQRGVNTELIDEGTRPTTRSYALALHPASLALLDDVGAATALINDAHVIDRVAFYDGKGERLGELRLDHVSARFPFLAVVGQQVLENQLEQKLREKRIKVKWNHRLSALREENDKIVATVDKLGQSPSGYAVAQMEWKVQKSKELIAPFLVGADGNRSGVRRMLGIELEQAAPAQVFGVFEFASDADLVDEVRVVFTDDTTNVLWPLPNNRYRWSFQLDEADVEHAERRKSRLLVQIGAESFPFLHKEKLAELLRERAPWFPMPQGGIDWSVAVRFENGMARTFGKGRCWLAGDSAHLTGPVGAQSMNAGLHEAKELAWRLGHILHGPGTADLLATYNIERSNEWQRLLGLGGALVTNDCTASWVRKNAARILPCIPGSEEALDQLAGQLNLTLP